MAREEISGYIEFYNQSRPHQAVYNFAPAHVHQLNNKSLLLQELKEMKKTTCGGVGECTEVGSAADF